MKIKNWFKRTIAITIFTRGGVVVDVECDQPIEFTVKDLDDIPALCLTCGVRDDRLTDVCCNGHDNWLEQIDIDQDNEFYHSALKQLGYSSEVFKNMFKYPKKVIKPNKC